MRRNGECMVSNYCKLCDIEISEKVSMCDECSELFYRLETPMRNVIQRLVKRIKFLEDVYYKDEAD